jgi:hypothetical protein
MEAVISRVVEGLVEVLSFATFQHSRLTWRVRSEEYLLGLALRTGLSAAGSSRDRLPSG